MPQDVFGEHIQNATVTDPGKTYFENKYSFQLANQSRKLRNARLIFFVSLLECLMKILAVSFLLSLRLLSGENCSGSPVAL